MTENLAGFAYDFVPGDSTRTLLLLHGTGGNEKSLVEIARTLDPSAHLLSPRGKVLENGMPRYFRRDERGVFDRNDLRLRTEELAQFIVEASHIHSFDLLNLIGVGYSNGANILSHLLFVHPEIVKAAISFRPTSQSLPDAPGSYDLKKKALFTAFGSRDEMTTEEDAQTFVSSLDSANADLTSCTTPGGHGLTPGDIDEARHWLQKLA